MRDVERGAAWCVGRGAARRVRRGLAKRVWRGAADSEGRGAADSEGLRRGRLRPELDVVCGLNISTDGCGVPARLVSLTIRSRRSRTEQ